MSVLLRKKYSSIKKEKLSEQAKLVLKSMYDTTDGFKDVKATRKIKPKFEAFYNKLKESKPEAIVGGKAKSKAATPKAAPKKSADDFKAARARRKSQTGVPKDKKAVDKDAIRPAINIKGKRTSKAGNTYYEYRDNRFDKNPSKYPMLEKGGKLNEDDTDEYARKLYKPVGVYSEGEKKVSAFKEGARYAKEIYAKGGETNKSDVYVMPDYFILLDEDNNNVLIKTKRFNKASDYSVMNPSARLFAVYKDGRKKDLGTHEETKNIYADGGMMAKGRELVNLLKEQEELEFQLTDIKLGSNLNTDEGVDKYRKLVAPLRAKLNEIDKKLEALGYEPYAKGGETKVPNTYIPNKDVKELMVVLKNKMVKLKGDDILDGVYAKNSSLKSTKGAKSTTSTLSVDEIYNNLVAEAKKLDDDAAAVKKEDIKQLIDAGYDSKDINLMYLGVNILDPKIDVDYDRSGLMGYTEEGVTRNVKRLVDAAKNKSYEIGFKYPEFNWSSIIKKYNISKNGKEINGDEMKFTNETEYYVYTVFEGDKVVIGTSTNRIRYKDGKKQPEDDYYKKDPKELAEFTGGYWGLVTSSKEVMYDILNMILSQKGKYVKDINVFVNGLGGIGYEELEKNDIKYKHGGYMADGGDLASEFSIEEMKKHLDNEFPDSFGFKLFPIKNGTSFEPDYDAEIVKGRATKGLSDYDLKPKKLMFPIYKRDHAINYNVTEGGENTYFDFLLSDTDGDKYYSGTFGFKDQGDVSPDYITKFIAFLMKSYGLPFKVNHSVYAKGGEVNKFDYMMLDRLRSDNEYYLGNGNRNPKNLWAGSVDGQIEEMKKLWNQLPKDKKPEWLSMEDIENYERKMKGDKMADGGMMAKGGETHRLDSIFEDGGEIAEGNLEMAMSNVKAIGHHAQELKSLLNEDTSIEAWVVAKLERAETDLSDVTHYIDGLKGEEVQSDTYFGRGGLTKEETMKVAEKYAEALSKSENKKFTVNTRTLEEDSFDLDMDGIEYDGGSYNIYDNGDVKNMALSGSPVYGKATYTVDEILRNQYSDSTKMAKGGYMANGGENEDLSKVDSVLWKNIENNRYNVSALVIKYDEDSELRLLVVENGILLSNWINTKYFEKQPFSEGMYPRKKFNKQKIREEVINLLKENNLDSIKKEGLSSSSLKYLKKYAKGGKLSKKDFFKKYEENEDENMHTENVVLLAENYGTESDIRDAKTILAKHESIGHLPTSLRQERDDLHDKLWSKYIQSREDGGMMAKGGNIKTDISKGSKYIDIVDMLNNLNIPENVYLNGKEYKGEVSVINGYNGYTSTPEDGLLGVFEPTSGNVWNGFKGYLKDEEGNYLRAQQRRGLTINVFSKGGYMADGGMMANGGSMQDVEKYVADKYFYGDTDGFSISKDNKGKYYFRIIDLDTENIEAFEAEYGDYDEKVYEIETDINSKYAKGGMMAKGGSVGKIYYHILEYGDYGNIGYQGYYETEEDARKEINRLSGYFPDMYYEIFTSDSMQEPPITTMAKGGRTPKSGMEKLLLEHIKEAQRNRVEITNFGWSQGDDYIVSKTTERKDGKHILTSKISNGVVKHDWDSKSNKYAQGGEINYLKKWRVKGINMQGKMFIKEITLGRMSDKNDVMYALKRMPDTNIREVTLIEEIKEDGGMMADGRETNKIPRYKVNIYEIGDEYDTQYSKYADTLDEAKILAQRGNQADIYDNEEKKYVEYAKGGRLSRKQKQLDLNKNGKLDSQDFKMLRAGRKNARKK
jgi:hypothetical protein